MPEEAGPSEHLWRGMIPDFEARDGRLHGGNSSTPGRKLARPLMQNKRLQSFHDKAYLTSQTTSWIAIKIYLDFGFVPLLESADCRDAWRLLALKLRHPALSEFQFEVI